MRLPEWEARLSQYIASHEGAVFAWGTVDCAMFAAGGVKAMTGVDPVEEFRGKYNSPISALRALRVFGAGTLLDTMDTKFTRIPATMAGRGDLAMHDGSLGIVFGSDALFVGEDGGAPGLVRIGRAQWDASWRV